jgi:broad specificity phosphatase PhoE
MFDLVQERDMGSRLAPRTMVYVITHGVADESGDLSEVGKNQVVDLARSRVVAGVTMIYSSSAKDTSTTAKILSKEFGAKTNTKDCLGEVKIGKGRQSTDELAKVLNEMWKDTDYQPEKGESLMEARHRLAECVTGFSGKHKGDSIAIVTHTMLATLFHTLVKGGDPTVEEWLNMGHASCAAYEYAKGGWTLVMPPDNSYLTEMTAVQDVLPLEVTQALTSD